MCLFDTAWFTFLLSSSHITFISLRLNFLLSTSTNIHLYYFFAMDERRCTNVRYKIRGAWRNRNPCDSFQYWGDKCSIDRRKMICCELSYCGHCIRKREWLGQPCYCRRTTPGVLNDHNSKLHWFMNNDNYRIFCQLNMHLLFYFCY